MERMGDSNNTKYRKKEMFNWFSDNCKSSAGPRPNLTGMRRIWGKDAKVVMCGGYAFLVSDEVFNSV